MCSFNDPEIRRSLGRPNRQVDVLQEEQLAALEDEEAGRGEFFLRLGFAKTWIIPRIVTAENHHRF